MPRLLNPQHEFFCRAYVNSPFAGNLTDAYEAAGFARDRGNAVRLSRQADVAARIVELRDADRAVERHAVREALEEVGVDRASLVRNYTTMMRANPLDYYTTEANGSVRPHLDRLDRQKGFAVREIVIDATSARASTAETKLRLRFYDKHKAMLALQKLIEFSEEIPVPHRDLPSPEQERDQVVATLRDYARFAEDDDVMAMAREAVAGARERYPEGNLTTFERIMSAVRRDREARAAHAAAAEAAAEQNAQELAAMAALLPGGAVARLKQSESRDDAGRSAEIHDSGSAPDVAALHPGYDAENHDSKSCHGAVGTVARLEQRESRDEIRELAPDVATLHPG